MCELIDQITAVKIFDNVVSLTLTNLKLDRNEQKIFIKSIMKVLGEAGWDTEDDSEFWDNELVQEVYFDLYDPIC